MSSAEFKAKGNAHLQKKEYDAAIEAYTKAIELNPNDHVFYSNRSAAYLSKGDAENALKDGELCIQTNPQFAKGYSRKGAALHSMKNYDAAIQSYKDGLVIAPEDAGLKSGLAEVEKMKSTPPPMKNLFPPHLLSKLAGHPKYGPKLADPAFMAKLNMVQSNPQLMLQDPEFMEIFGLLMGGDKEGGEPGMEAPASSYTPPPAAAPKAQPKPEPEPEEELTEEEKKTRENKKLSVAAKEKGNALYKNKQFDEALTAYDEAIALDPKNILFLSNKAAVYIERGEFDEAIKVCNDAVENARAVRASYEDVAKVYGRQATAWIKKGDIPEAIASYRKGQMEFFDKATERKIKNLELEQKEKLRKAYIDPEKAMEAKERGNTAFRESNFSVAITEYEDAIKRDPSNAAYRNNLAATLLKIGDFNAAKSNVEKSLELDPKYVKAWAKKGDIEFFMKEYHKALDSYKMGLSIEPDHSLCKQGLQKTINQINIAQSSAPDADRQAHAMADPEIQAILMDPTIRQVLQDAQDNPASIQRALSDPVVKYKIDKLVAAGVLQVK